MKRILWLALNNKNQIVDTWYIGCVQSFNKWKNACKNIKAIKFQRHKITLHDWVQEFSYRNLSK